MTERAANELLSLPMFPELTDEQVDEAMDLVGLLRTRIPDSPLIFQIETASAQWRQKMGMGNLSPELTKLAQDVDHELKIMDLTMMLFLGGKERTEEEFRTLFAASGWKLNRIIPTAGMPIRPPTWSTGVCIPR